MVGLADKTAPKSGTGTVNSWYILGVNEWIIMAVNAWYIYGCNLTFRPQYVKYSIGRLGMVPKSEIENVSLQLSEVPVLELGNGNTIFKLLIANSEKHSDTKRYFFRSLEHAEDFIEDRVQRYPEEKFAGRMFFKSSLFQHTIDRIHREHQAR